MLSNLDFLSMMKFSALFVATALSLSVIGAPPAFAAGSSSPELRQPDAGEMKFLPAEPPALGSAYTGSAPVSLLLAALSIGEIAKVITDNVPAFREGLDSAISQISAALGGTR